MSETEANESKNSKNNKFNKKWLGIIIALILLLIGFYLYYFYPQMGSGLAVIGNELGERVNVLIVGLDDRDSVEKGEIEADSIVLVRLEAEKKILTFTAIPPNTKIDDESLKKISPEKMSEKIEEVIGVEPEYYFAIGYKGFEKVVDELSGIEVNLEEPLKVPDLGLYLKEGKNLLSGKEALNYSRWYDYTKDEKDRIKRQQQVLVGIVDKVLQSKTLLNIPKLYTTVIETFKSIETNLDQALISEVFEFLRNRNNMEINYKIFTGE
jgi:LCP family protein required for cell wall assembly